MTIDYPKDYRPSSLKIEEEKVEPRELAFGIGYDDGEGGFAMFGGPFPTLEEALETVPASGDAIFTPDLAVIIRYNENGTDDVIYRWKHNRWEYVKDA